MFFLVHQNVTRTVSLEENLLLECAMYCECTSPEKCACGCNTVYIFQRLVVRGACNRTVEALLVVLDIVLVYKF